MSLSKAFLFPKCTLNELKEFINDIPRYDEIYENPNLTKEFILEHLEKFNYFKLQKYGFEEPDFIKYLDRLNIKSWKSIPVQYHELITLEAIDSFELNDYDLLVYAVKDIRVYQKYYTKMVYNFSRIPLEVLLDWNFFRTWIKEGLNVEGEVISYMSEEHLLYLLQERGNIADILVCGIFDLKFFENHLLDKMNNFLYGYLLQDNIDYKILVKYKNCIIKNADFLYQHILSMDIPFFVIRDYYPLTLKDELNKWVISLTNRGQEKYNKPLLYSVRHYYINNKRNSMYYLSLNF